MKIASRNEYDPLRSIVVGDATDARFPEQDEIFRFNHSVTAWKDSQHPEGKFPDHVISETNEDLEILAQTLQSFGVDVYRPSELNFTKVVKTHDWQSDGMYNYCPRDVLLIIDDMVIEAPMAYRSRQMEAAAYWQIKRSAIKSGARWISAPRPRLLTEENYIHNNNIRLTEEEPIFDAANVLRLNNDILYLVSNSGNRMGAQWLQNVLGKTYRVHLLDNLYSYAHIDSTISVLRQGLVVLNASRVNEHNCPKVFDGWTKIYIDEVVPQSFYKYPYASKWIALNMLSIDPDTVVVDKNQIELIKTLERHSMTVVPLELRHSRTLGGGFHCVTLDLERE